MRLHHRLLPLLLLVVLFGCGGGSGGGGTVEPPEDNQTPSVTLSADTLSGQTPLTVNFTASATDPEGSTLFYTWDFGQGTQLEGSSSRTFTFLQPGTYPVTVTASDGEMSQSASVTVDVSEGAPPEPGNTPPTVDLSADVTEGQAPLSVQFDTQASDPDGDSLSYLLNFGDGDTASSADTTHTYQEAGRYTASVTVSDGRGGVVTDEVKVNVTEDDDNNPPPPDPPENPGPPTNPTPGNQPPSAVITVASQDGLTVRFSGAPSSDSDGAISRYAWTFGDGEGGAGQVISHTYDRADTYTIKLTVTDNDGATNTATRSVTVQASGGGETPNPAPTITSFTATPPTISGGESSTLSWQVQGTVTELTIDQGVGTVTSTTSKQVSPAATTTYTLTAKNGTATATKQVKVTVQPSGGGGGSNSAPTVSITKPSGPIELTLNNGAVTSEFVAQASDSDGDDVSLQWSVSPAATISAATASTTNITFASATTYKVTVTARDNKGGETAASVNVTINNPATEPEPENDEPVAEIDVIEGSTSFVFGDLLTSKSLTLSGTDSTDAEDDAEGRSLSYQWRVATAPSGSSAQPTRVDGNPAVVTFTPDKIGTYRVVLRVIDSGGDDDETPQTITVATPSLSISGEATVPQLTSETFTLNVNGSPISEDVSTWTLTSPNPNYGSISESGNSATYTAPNNATTATLTVKLNDQYVASGKQLSTDLPITVP